MRSQNAKAGRSPFITTARARLPRSWRSAKGRGQKARRRKGGHGRTRAHRASGAALSRQITCARSTHAARGSASHPLRPEKSRAPRSHAAGAILGFHVECELLLQPRQSNTSQPRLSRRRILDLAPAHWVASPWVDRTRRASVSLTTAVVSTGRTRPLSARPESGLTMSVASEPSTK